MKSLIILALCLTICSCNKNSCNCPIPVLGKDWALLDTGTDTSEIDCKIYKGVRAYLREVLKDDSSYQPISFAEFRPIYPDEANRISEYLSKRGYFNDSTKVKSTKLDSLWNVYIKYKRIGYTIKHKYRAKNGWGAYGLGCEKFRMDTAFNVIYSEETTYMEDDYKKIMREYQAMKDRGEIK